MPWKERDTVNLREEFVLKALGNAMPFGTLCNDYGVSRKTGYKWIKRFHEHGLGGLRDMSRRPRESPNALSERVACELIRIKMSCAASWGPKKVRELYKRKHGEAPSLSSVKRVMERAGFVQHRRRRRQGEMGRAQEGCRPKKPNEQWSVDFKGWWKTRDGERCEPLTVRDGYSRYLLDLRAMSSIRTEDVLPAFERLFEQYGVPESIRSDNGSPFASAMAPMGLSRLSVWWISLGIRLDRIDPGRPDQNGAHERIHRDIRSELQLTPADDAVASQSLFDEWKNIYNWQRPHEAIEMKMPGELYEPSGRIYESGKTDIAYPADWLERRVSPNGSIKLGGVAIAVSSTLAGWTVGLQPVAERLDIWFDYLRLGHIDLHTFKFMPIMTKKRRRSSSGRLAARRRNQAR